MFNPAALGQKIMSLRAQKGLSDEELSKFAELNRKYLKEMENNIANSPILNTAHTTSARAASRLNIKACEHVLDKEELKIQLHKMIDKASENDLATIYHILEAVIP